MEHPRQGFIPTSNGYSLIVDPRQGFILTSNGESLIINKRLGVNSLIEEQCVIEEETEFFS